MQVMFIIFKILMFIRFIFLIEAGLLILKSFEKLICNLIDESPTIKKKELLLLS